MNHIARTLAAVSVSLALAATAAAQPQRHWLDMRFGRQKTRVSFNSRGYWDREVKEQDTEMGLQRHEVRIAAPIFQDETQELSAGVAYTGWNVDTAAVLPDTGESFPSCLHDVRISMDYRRKLDNDWVWGAGVTVGSPSDRPFASNEEISVTARSFLRIPHGDRNAWLIMLAFSNVRDFAPYVPLPGVGYHWRPNDRTSILAGFPFSMVRWEPVEKLLVEASWLMLRNVRAKVSYELLDGVRVYGLFEWDSERFFRHDRGDEDDRLQYYEKRAGGGVEIELHENITLDLSGGYAFDRFFFEADEYDDRDENRLELQDGAFAGVQVNFRF
ncbi:MAG: outer membrane protein [Phycisphaerae bacterium]